MRRRRRRKRRKRRCGGYCLVRHLLHRHRNGLVPIRPYSPNTLSPALLPHKKKRKMKKKMMKMKKKKKMMKKKIAKDY